MTWIGSSHPSWWRTKVWSNVTCPVVHNITPLASLGTVAMTSTPSETEEKQFFSCTYGHHKFLCGLRLCSTVSVVCVISMKYIKWMHNVKLTASLSICMFLPLSHLTLLDPMSNLVRHYDFPILLRCRVMSDTFFFAFLRPLRCRSLSDTFFLRLFARSAVGACPTLFHM